MKELLVFLLFFNFIYSQVYDVSIDVKCSHGSTTGQLDESVLFYLQSRITLLSLLVSLELSFALTIYQPNLKFILKGLFD